MTADPRMISAAWRLSRQKKVHGWCLRDVRASVLPENLHLPPPQESPNNTAIWCGRELARNPAAYGWKHAAGDEPFTLVFFEDCGDIPGSGRLAGHVAVLDRESGMLRSSWDYRYDDWWKRRKFYEAVPLLSANVPARPETPVVSTTAKHVAAMINGRVVLNGALVVTSPDGKHTYVRLRDFLDELTQYGIASNAELGSDAVIVDLKKTA